MNLEQKKENEEVFSALRQIFACGCIAAGLLCKECLLYDQHCFHKPEFAKKIFPELFEKQFPGYHQHLTVKENKENKHLENPGALTFLGQLKGEKQGLPYWVIFDKKGNVLENSLDSKGSNLGCPYTKEEVQQFISKLKNTSRLNEEQLDIIRDVFVKKG